MFCKNRIKHPGTHVHVASSLISAPAIYNTVFVRGVFLFNVFHPHFLPKRSSCPVVMFSRLYPVRSSGIEPFVFCNYSFLGMVLIDGMGKNMLYKDIKATMYYRQMKKSSLHC